MKLLYTLLVFAFASQFAFAAECAHKIVLLPQLLAKRSEMRASPVALSQYLVWREIAARPDVPVFSENVQEDLSAEDERPTFDISFPKTPPGDFNQLSGQNRRVLIEFNGDMAALNGGQVQTVLAVMNVHQEMAGVDRVRKALGEIKSYFSINEDVKTVILVFGAEFDLKSHEDLFDPVCIETPQELEELTKP